MDKGAYSASMTSVSIPSIHIKSQTWLCVPVTPSLNDRHRQIWTAHQLARLAEMVSFWLSWKTLNGAIRWRAKIKTLDILLWPLLACVCSCMGSCMCVSKCVYICMWRQRTISALLPQNNTYLDCWDSGLELTKQATQLASEAKGSSSLCLPSTQITSSTTMLSWKLNLHLHACIK